MKIRRVYASEWTGWDHVWHGGPHDLVRMCEEVADQVRSEGWLDRALWVFSEIGNEVIVTAIGATEEGGLHSVRPPYWIA